MRLPIAIACVVAVGLFGCDGTGKVEAGKTGEGSGGMALTVKSTSFENSGKIPKKYTGEGEDVSPQISWTGAPAKAQSFALICDDPDAPRATPWVHWVLYNIPANVTELAEGSNGGATAGMNDMRKPQYNGPMPPPGHGVHHYHFKVYTLDMKLNLKPGLTKDELLVAMKGHIAAQGELVGTYERK